MKAGAWHQHHDEGGLETRRVSSSRYDFYYYDFLNYTNAYLRMYYAYE